MTNARFAVGFALRTVLACALVVGVLGVAELAWFTPLPQAASAVARGSLRDRHGTLLRDARDAHARRYLPAPKGIERGAIGAAFVVSEDRRLFEHAGVDVRAALRALWVTARQGRVRSGASTMAMQLARLREGRAPGVDLWHKLRDMVLAWRLTRAMGPDGVLRAYLDEVPLGSRVVGVEAAAQRTFGKSSSSLDVAEAAVLASFARAPSSAEAAITSGRVRDRIRWRAAELVRRMAALGRATKADEASVAVVVGSLVGERARGVANSTATRFDALHASRSTLDAHTGINLDNELRAALVSTRGRGVSHAAGLVVDLATMEVRAARTLAAEGDPWFDGTASRRQPGSTLKPFLVALALEELPREELVVRDEPVAFAGEDDVFEPRNYDGRFHGDVPVEDVLARSLNVPALRLAAKVGTPRLLGFLREIGFTSLEAAPEHYGLNLALGDGEVSLDELAAAYACLANEGLYRPLRWSLDAPEASARRVIDRDVARIVTRMLDDDPRRAPTFDRSGIFAAPYPLAAKTGTSRDHRDAWAVGFTRTTLVAVWVGRADGGPTREVNGARGPGPAVRALLDASHPDGTPFPLPSADAWSEEAVCTADRTGNARRCERERLVYRRRSETARAARASTARPEASRFVFPAHGARFVIASDRPVAAQGLRVLVEGTHRSGALAVRDGNLTLPVIAGRSFALPLTAGNHRLALLDEGRVVDERVVEVVEAP